MATFRVDLPADPKWLHVARTMTDTSAAAALSADTGELDDLALVVGEATLAVTTTVGVTEVSVTAETSPESMRVDISGIGDLIEYDDDGINLLTVALETLARRHSVSRSPTEYRISLEFGAGRLPA